MDAASRSCWLRLRRFITSCKDSAAHAELAATITVMIVVILSWVLDGVPQVAWLHPWLIVHEWMSFGDFLRDPVSLDSAGRGLLVALGYAVVFLAAAWARLLGKDVTS